MEHLRSPGENYSINVVLISNIRVRFCLLRFSLILCFTRCLRLCLYIVHSPVPRPVNNNLGHHINSRPLFYMVETLLRKKKLLCKANTITEKHQWRHFRCTRKTSTFYQKCCPILCLTWSVFDGVVWLSVSACASCFSLYIVHSPVSGAVNNNIGHDINSRLLFYGWATSPIKKKMLCKANTITEKHQWRHFRLTRKQANLIRNFANSFISALVNCFLWEKDDNLLPGKLYFGTAAFLVYNNPGKSLSHRNSP